MLQEAGSHEDLTAWLDRDTLTALWSALYLPLMEYVSVLAGERFSDHPRCTDPALAELARLVNDLTVDDAARAELVRRAPDLAATSDSAYPTATVLAAVAEVGLALDATDRILTRTAARARRAQRPPRYLRRVAALVSRAGERALIRVALLQVVIISRAQGRYPD